MTIRALVADDEPLARRRLLRLLKSEPDVEVVGVAGSGRAAVDAIRAQRPDLVFLDVQMPELDGFGVLEALGDAMPVVIFVTAYDQYALRAFEVQALDYLLKPFDAERFAQAFRRARSQLRAGDAPPPERLLGLLDALSEKQKQLDQLLSRGSERYLERLMVKSAGKIFFVRTAEVHWLEAEGNYIRLHLGGRSHLIRETMNNLETRLDPERFARIHRSTIVNLDQIKELRPWFGGDYLVFLQDGTELKLSRSYRERLAVHLGSPD